MRVLVRRWLLVLNVAVLATGLVLGATGARRGFFLAALVPLALMPFSYARVRLHDTLARAVRVGPLDPALAVTSIVFDVVLIAQLVTARSADPVSVLHGPIVAWLGPVWFSGHAFLFLGYALLGLARTLHRVLDRSWTFVTRPAPAARRAVETTGLDAPASLGRREFLRNASVAGAALPFVASASGVSTSYDFRVEEREIVLPRWPRELDGLRVVHLSDIHVGGGMTRERLLGVAELTNRARPELILHTGDFLTHRSGDFDTPLYEALAKVHAPLGQWACLGNHDYDDPETLVHRLRDAGVVVLRNRLTHVEVAGTRIEIAGADFMYGPIRDAAYARLVNDWGSVGAAPRLLLNHDPSAFHDLPDETASLVLSGHTHGGHVGIQLGPSRALTVVGLLGLPDQGLFARNDMRLFVTRCVGFYGYPMRVGIPPEIAVLTLRSPGTTTTGTRVRPA